MRLKTFWLTFLLTLVVSLWQKENKPKETVVIKQETPVATVSAEPKGTAVKVIKVIDGDTVQVKMGDKTETIRLIGMNAPESVDPKKTVQCFAKEASAKAKELLMDKEILLEADETQGDIDVYKRELRYVFLPDGTNFSKVMIANGFAREYTYRSKKYKYQTEFKQAQIEAKLAKSGLWGVCK